MTYNEINIHPRDARLKFRAEDHVYTVGDQTLRPVTSVVESCFEQFDTDYWAPRQAARLGIPESEVRKMWEEKGNKACALGTDMHARIEKYYLGEGLGDFDTRHLFEAFTRTRQLHPYRTEWSVYDEALGVAGTIDFLEYHDGVFRIYDWKRSDKLIFQGKPVVRNSFGKSGLGAMCHVPDTAFWHYALQLSIYRFLLARNYDIEVESCHLVVLHPNNSMPYLLSTPYLRKEVEKILCVN